MTHELFRSGDLRVVRVGDHGARCCVVTFDSFNDSGQMDRPGFGEAFLDQAGIDAVHVTSRGNDWYQYPEVPAAMASMQATTRSYDRVVAYGSSMGGYAAIRLAELVGAQAVLALSPQFSIDRRVVPWERRWSENSAGFRDVWERAMPWPTLADAYVVYDPKTLDRRHAALLRANFACTTIALPGIGHPVTGFLAELGLLQRAILAVCGRTFDPMGFAREAFDARMGSAQYLVALAQAGWRRRRDRIAILQEAVRLAPGNAMACCRLGQYLVRAGRYDEGLAMHRRALEIAPGHSYFAWVYSVSLEASGQVGLALTVLEQVASSTVSPLRYGSRLHELRARTTRQFGQVRGRDAGRGVSGVTTRAGL